MYPPYEKNWVPVYCPVCKKKLGDKTKGTLGSFICNTEGCSKTKHYFYPGELKRPGKSIPWFKYHSDKTCGCSNCKSLDSKITE